MFEVAARMIMIVSKPESFGEFVLAMAAACPLDQDPGRLKAVWKKVRG